MTLNFTASFLDKLGIELFDELGHAIPTISYSKEMYLFEYSKPKVTYDILKRPGIEEIKEPQLTKIGNFKRLESLGFILCVVPIKNGWYKGQRVMYALIRKGTIEEKSYKKLLSFPRQDKINHHVIYDEANGKVKLVGKKSGPTGEGEWIMV